MAEVSAGQSSNQPNLEFIERNGGKVLLRAGYQYTKMRLNKAGITRWRCVNYKKKKCKGALSTNANGIISAETLHTDCVPNTVANELALHLNKLRKNVISTQDSVKHIYEEAVATYENTGLAIVQKAPKYVALKSNLYKIRNREAGVTKMHFKTLIEVQVPKKYQTFVLSEFSDDKERIIVFCLPEMRQRMDEIQHCFIDGTFRSCPKHFCELYVILGDFGSTAMKTNVVPLMFALVSKRNKKTYRRLFQIIKAKLPNFKPSKFMLDYEQAVIGALKAEFPEAELKGCYFHFSHSVWKKGKELNLTKCNEARRTVALSALLPLLPKTYIDEAWTYITENIILSEKAKELDLFVDYMMRQWLKNDEWMEFWNVSRELHRTNNATESWNGRLNKLIKKKQPTLLNLLQVLHQESKLAITKMDSDGTAKQTKYVSRNRWICFVLEQLENKTISVGHCLEKLRK